MKYLYACDDAYAGLTAISAFSLLRHNPQAEIILLGDKLSCESTELVRSRVEMAGGKFRYVETSPLIDQLRKAGVPHYSSYSIFSRLYAPKLLPEISERILYLDSDTLVVGSLAELEGLDLHGHPMALGLDAAHPAYKRHIGIDRGKSYFNTGVFLMDTEEWRRRNCTERIVEELIHPTGNLTLPEQDAIARIMNDEVEPLDVRWNYLSQFVLCRIAADPAIYHFSGNTLGRPWYTSSRHPMRSAYHEVAKAAGLGEFAELVRPLPFEYALECRLYKLMPRWAFRLYYNLTHRLHIYLTYGK